MTQEQITDSTNGNRIYGYSYDKVSNRLTKVETIAGTTTTINYAYDANDRLLSEIGTTTATYVYDNNGNTLSKTENGLTTTYIWNSEPAPRMIGAVTTDANGVVTQQMSYQYDADGMRVSAIVNGEETRYLLDVVQPYAQVREEYSPDGTVKVSYVYGNDLIQQTRGTDTTYYHVDGLGSTRVLTDLQAQIVAAYNFDAYGELINSTGTTTNNYLSAGEQYDANLGDYYLRQRYYSPSTGRFGRRDTWEGKLADPMSLHKYGYAHGNPVSFTDPSGFYSTTEIMAGLKGMTVLQGLNVAVNLTFYGIDIATGNVAGVATSFVTDIGALLLGSGAATANNVKRATTILGRFFSKGRTFRIGAEATGTNLAHNLLQFGYNKMPGGIAHHIVPGNETYVAAVQARGILQKWSIDINSPINGLFMPGRNTPATQVVNGVRHTGRHLQIYYDEVLDTLLRNGALTSKEGAYRALLELRDNLRTGVLRVNN